MFKTQQADNIIHEDQLLNFLVNTLGEEVALDLAAVQIDVQVIYKVLVGTCADGTSNSIFCDSSEISPAANTVFYHLRTSHKHAPQTGYR